MFGKNKYSVCIDGTIFNVDDICLVRAVERLKDELRGKECVIAGFKNELRHIKPILEHKDFKPAVSKDCADCKFVVKSPYNYEVLGCRKDNLCEDFSPKEE